MRIASTIPDVAITYGGGPDDPERPPSREEGSQRLKVGCLSVFLVVTILLLVFYLW